METTNSHIHTYKGKSSQCLKKTIPGLESNLRNTAWCLNYGQGFVFSCLKYSPDTLTEKKPKKNPRRLLFLFQLQEEKQNEVDAVGSLMRQAEVSPAQSQPMETNVI
uniref:Uncharacterized protein n=1 Tax=Micrurus carvalhoi TaxID=3147026 RepID=A0A2H6N6G6_9SAUR